MIRFYENASGFSETSEWHPRCWVNVIMPTTEDVAYLTEELCLPEDFLDDISDVDERPRLERNGKWMMAILRIPVYEAGRDVPYFTVPIGVMLNGDYIVTVCNFRNALTDDFIEHTRKRGIVVRSSVDFILRLLNSSAYFNSPAMAIYGSSKAALNHLASNLAFDYGPMGIRINCVGPGALTTPWPRPRR